MQGLTGSVEFENFYSVQDEQSCRHTGIVSNGTGGASGFQVTGRYILGLDNGENLLCPVNKI